MIPLLALAAFLVLPARAADTLEAVDLQQFRPARRAAGPPAAEAAAAAPAPQPAPAFESGGVDMAPFLRRLEDLGMRTGTMRVLLGQIRVSFDAPGASANAQWKWIRKILVLPDSLKQPGSSAIRYDLAPNEVSTVIHELTHAANSMLASETAPKGTPAFEHFDAANTIWADLRSSAYFYRYGRFKADEVSGYFMGAAYSEVFDAVGDIVLYNTTRAAPAGADLNALGSTLILPAQDGARDDYEKALAERQKRPFGTVSVNEDAMFEGAPIGWEERPMTKTQMYKNILGLSPPKDRAELLKRLNEADNEWIRDVKRRTLETRRRLARPKP